jgi:hypothetical protein
MIEEHSCKVEIAETFSATIYTQVTTTTENYEKSMIGALITPDEHSQSPGRLEIKFIAIRAFMASFLIT